MTKFTPLDYAIDKQPSRSVSSSFGAIISLVLVDTSCSHRLLVCTHLSSIPLLLHLFAVEAHFNPRAGVDSSAQLLFMWHRAFPIHRQFPTPSFEAGPTLCLCE